MQKHTQIAVIGAGIVGLSIARAEALKGHQVTVFERDSRAVGATIRNFGMIWPIGQAVGPALDRALRTRAIWGDFTKESGLWHNAEGSLHLAYHEDELAVLEAFGESVGASYQCKLLSAKEAINLSPATKPKGLLGALWSGTEMIVDPREVPATLAQYLQETLGVNFKFGTAVTDISESFLSASGERWTFERAWLCGGSDFETLFAETFANSGLNKVKLQMMRTLPQPEDWKMGPALAAGLTLTHYASFAHCQAELAQLKSRIKEKSPWFEQWGIHVMMSQNGKRELILGDSHEYGSVHDPFVREDINQYILDYLFGFAQAPDWRLAERWYGVYAKLPGQTEYVSRPLPNVRIVTGLSGAGMTLSFGLGEELVRAL
ncbi:MAG: TIGR03364 family FAD-dependent oxidoreductase [Bacteroidota bacterium]